MYAHRNGSYKMIRILNIPQSDIKFLKRRVKRMWMHDNSDKINLLNYWYYRYFTSSYMDYLIWYFNFDAREEYQEGKSK